MSDSDKHSLPDAFRRALALMDPNALAELARVSGFNLKTLEAWQKTGTTIKASAITLTGALHKLGHHDRAAHIDSWLKGAQG